MARRAPAVIVSITATLLLLCSGAVGASASGFSAARALTPGSSSFTAPVYQGDFPDPAVLDVGGTYWAYATGAAGRNLQVMSAPDLAQWTAPTDPLPALPSWTSTGLTWAPSVIARGGVYLMYYAVHDAALGHQCISVATSFTPGGPFSDASSGPLVCQTANGGSIDPDAYLDPVSGGMYLIWKSDDNSLGAGHVTHLWGQQLSSNGLSFASGSAPSLLLSQSARWQAPAIEGPVVIHSGGRYYLFYGANNYDTASSAIGYATSSTLLGGYANQSKFAPWLGTTGNAQGPQGPAVFTDSSGATRMALAAWYGTVGYENGGVRSLWIGSLRFSRSGTPTLS